MNSGGMARGSGGCRRVEEDPTTLSKFGVSIRSLKLDFIWSPPGERSREATTAPPGERTLFAYRSSTAPKAV